MIETLERVSEKPRATGLRVLKVAPTSFFADYGCHVRILEETLAIQRHGATVAICTYPGGRDVDGVDVLRSAGAPWGSDVRVGSSYHRLYLDAFLGGSALAAALRFRPHVIHAHLHEGALLGWPAARLLGVPLVFDFQGSLTSEMLDHDFISRRSLFFEPLRAVETFISRRPDAVLTSSHNAAEIVVGQFGVARAKVRPLPDAVDGRRFRPRWSYSASEVDALRRELGLPRGKRVIVYLGLLAEYQGSGHLLRAAARLLATRADFHFLLMGYPGQDRYRDYARVLGIDDRVTFTGRVPYERAPEYLAIGDVAVSSKLSETEGNGKLLNYMAVGLPTVSFDTPVSREILGPLGRYAALGDDASLAIEMERLLDDPQLDRIGRGLRSRAEELFSWDDAGRQILDIYAELMRS